MLGAIVVLSIAVSSLWIRCTDLLLGDYAETKDMSCHLSEGGIIGRKCCRDGLIGG